MRLFASFFFLVLFSISSVVASAQISISPYNANNLNLDEKNWFIFQAKVGQTIQDSVRVNNLGKTESQINISAKDMQILENGSFTILSDQTPNTEIGNWFKLDTSTLVLAAKDSTEIPFKIEIPQNILDGEYAGGISFTENTPAQDKININIRKGIRTYVTVGDDLKLDFKATQLNIADPKDSNFDKLKTDKPNFGKNNLLLEFEAENLGNIFGILDCKYALNYADGTNYENTYSVDLAPRVGFRKYYINTNQEYKLGKTQAILDCQIKPQNIEAKKLKTESQKLVISDSLDLEQNELSGFEMSRQDFFTPTKQNISDSKIDQAQIIDSKSQNTLLVSIWLYLAIGLVLVFVFAVAVFYYKTKKTK